MNRDEEIQKQLEEGKPVSGDSHSNSYKLLFSLLKEEPDRILDDKFEDRVLAGLESQYPLGWKEFLVLVFLILLPVFGMFYWSDFAKSVSNIPAIKWVGQHAVEIVFGLLIVVGVQLADIVLKKKLHITE